MQRGDLLVDRCPTGIPGFDDLCNGGFVRESVNAVLGGPGSGKTTFLLQFLYAGVTIHNEPGLFVSFEPDVTELFKDATALGWDFQKLDSQDKCKFMRVSPRTSLPELKSELTKVVSKYGIKRICFDPIGLFGAGEESPGKLRQIIFDLADMLRRLKVTVLLSDETASGDTEEVGVAASEVQSQYIKFLVDGLVDLYSSGLGGVSDRAVRIAKMRRTAHQRGPVPMELTNNGMRVLYKKGGKKGLI